MTEHFYVDHTGSYLGAFLDATPPIGAVEVPFPPGRANDCWDGTEWVPCEPSIDEKIAALDADLAAKLSRFNSQFVEASFANGSNENTRIADLRLERDQAMTDYADAIMTLIMEQ